jgi:hypothetical protein
MKPAIGRDVRICTRKISTRLLVGALSGEHKTSAPSSWFAQFASASHKNCAVRKPSAAGHGIVWPHLHEDFDVEGVLRQRPAGWTMLGHDD